MDIFENTIVLPLARQELLTREDRVMWTLRHHIAHLMIHTGLRVMPPGRARRELSELLWTWAMQVQMTVAAHRATDAANNPRG